MATFTHLNLDDAWADVPAECDIIEAREWGPRLRFTAPRAAMEQFYLQTHQQLGCFVVYGSGELHHVTALLVRRVRKPVTLISFDKHPDWDIRPPHWSCGGWTKRALELPHVRGISVWGCAEADVSWPRRVFANHRALLSGRMAVHAWREDWREQFAAFARRLAERVYVTIDLDCLRADAAVTNWGNGHFTTGDLSWALGELKRENHVIAGDICGAFSPPRFARLTQRLASAYDHPRLATPPEAEARRINSRAIAELLPALTNGN